MTSGIYRIRNLKNGNTYIGSAISLTTRRRQHLAALRSGRHDNGKLQRAWNKYGQEVFSFEILLFCDPDRLIFYEQAAIDSLKPYYNICRKAGSTFGRKMSVSARKKMSLAKLGHTPTESQLAALAAGRNPGGWNAGRPLPDWHRKKISDAMKGKQNTLGHTLSLEHRRKLSLRLIGNKRGSGRPHDSLGRFCSPTSVKSPQ